MFPFRKDAQPRQIEQEQRRRQLALCAYCPKLCSHTCPVSRSTKRETHSPWGKQSLLFELTRESLPLTAEWVEPLFACTGCLACGIVCDHHVDVPSTLLAGRSAVLERGLLPQSLRSMLRLIPQREKEARSRAMEAGGGESWRSARTVLVPGCRAAAEHPAMLEASVRILREIGGDDSAVYQEHCCGLPWLHAGDIAGFREAARRVVEDLQDVRTIVVLDPGCAWTMSVLYPRHGIGDLRPRIRTLVEFVLPHVQRLVRHQVTQGPVFYHDPCLLGRGLGIYEAPREILLRLVPGGARELHLSRDAEPCCGGGGAVPESMPEVAAAAAGRLASAFRERGARTVVTACPTCQATLGREPGIDVVDLHELIASSL